ESGDPAQHPLQVARIDAGVSELELGPGGHLLRGPEPQAHPHEAGPEELPPQQVGHQELEPTPADPAGSSRPVAVEAPYAHGALSWSMARSAWCLASSDASCTVHATKFSRLALQSLRLWPRAGRRSAPPATGRAK